MDPNEVEYVPIKDLKMEEGAEDLMDSALMEPYLRAAVALMGGQNPEGSMADIAALPLERRYVWRVASALKWGFADFDNLCVEIDRDTLPPEDREKVIELLKHRPIQFCMFLKALLGAEEMQRMMVQAIKVARQMP